MDLDAYVATHQSTWAELDELSRKPRLSSAEADRLVKLYQQTTTHLSTLRSQAPDATLVMSLSAVVSRSRRKLGSSSESLLHSIQHFFSTSFPVELYRLRWWWLSLMIVSYLYSAAIATWVYLHPELHDLLASPAVIRSLVNHDFEAYYNEYAHSHFATSVWVNNAWVSAQAVAMGFTGIYVLNLLRKNMLNLGINAGLMIYYGKAGLFWGLILPHGLLELTAVFVACGAGLSLFWAWVHPGAMTMAESFAQAGRRVMVIVLGLIAVLAIAGFIEGFVTPSSLPTFVRVGIGVVAFGAFLFYALVLGRKRFLEGDSSDVADWQRAEVLKAAE
ncbi:stage II sporulation protein M [Gleimia sp. 6138-11-ORH1]|uniref:stage II sporulation protein M n=1 Tax=Gleimia sp. 6138-11-ORH1 TaxID=2973937 RepID=UPI00216878E1|nr:stage II sporulation protein M [Gleimia sp. 6138-11-ORH1]MCS4485050.1 stage II sporulation protein M [Gleimia sp. 6138-11-ORH1]